MAARRSEAEDPPAASHASQQPKQYHAPQRNNNLIRRRASSSPTGSGRNNVEGPNQITPSSPRRKTMAPSYARGETGSGDPPPAVPSTARNDGIKNTDDCQNNRVNDVRKNTTHSRGQDEECSHAVVEEENDYCSLYSSSLHSDEEAAAQSRRAILPQMLSVTVPKRIDQPAGLTLSSLSSGSSAAAGGPRRRASKSQQQREKSTRKFAETKGDSSTRSLSSRRDSMKSGGSGVVISSISPQSPFFHSKGVTDDVSDGSKTLEINDEILLINNHRVKDPKRAAQMIKATTSGSLTIVASRGERMHGMNYHLARIEDDNKSRFQEEKKESKWQERKEEEAISGQYQLQLGGGGEPVKSVCGMTFVSSNNESLLRISSIESQSPFARTGMKVGDVLLAVDGTAIKSAGDAHGLLSQEDDNNGNRVVTLLVYSFWDLRHKVLSEEMQIEGESNSNSKQPWQATWSYKQADEPKEYVILRIPNTTVTFQLDFDEDGTCSCSEPCKALESIPSENNDEEDSGSLDGQSNFSDSKSRHSRDEARAALELLYQKHMSPTIDALNYHTWRQVRLLANALNASVTSSDDKKSEAKRGTAKSHEASDMELATTAAIATIRQQRMVRKSQTGESVMGDEITKPRGCTPPPKHASKPQAEQAVPTEHTPMKERTREPECAQDVHTSAEPLRSGPRRPSRGEHPPSSRQHRRQASTDSFQEQLGKLQLKQQGTSGRLSKVTPEGPNVQSRSIQPSENINNDPPPATAAPPEHRKSVETTAATVPTSDAVKPNPAQNRRRRPATGLRRRPSIVPVFKSKRASMLTQLSALSDSSASGTSTTSSDDSDSSNDSEESSDSEDDESSRPEAHHKARAQAPRQAQRRTDQGQANEQRRRPRQQRASLELSASTQLVLYNPEANQGNSKKTEPRTPPTLAPHTKVPKLKCRLKMRNGDIREQYKVSPRILGTGAFGTVRSCLNRKSRKQFAVKSILKRGNIKNATLLKNEIALVQRVHHANVVRVVDVIQDLEYIHIVMEECRGGDLFDRIVDGGVKLGEERACEIIGSLVDAISYLHDRDIVHRDLKAEHIMLTDDDIDSPVKIIDFGLATIHSAADPPMTAFAGSAFTVAPEVVKRSYGKECDLWSVGVITYFLLTSRMPFNANSDKEIFEKILSGNYGYPLWTQTGLSEEAKDFIDRLLVVDPKRRLTAKQALSHLWIRKHNKNRLASSMNSHELMLVPAGENAIVPVSNNEGASGNKSPLTPNRRRQSLPVQASNSRRLPAREPSARELPTERRQQRERGPMMRQGRPAQHQPTQQQQRTSTDASRKNLRRSPKPTTHVSNVERGTGRVASSRGLRRPNEPAGRAP